MFASSSLYNCLKKQESLPKQVNHYPAVFLGPKFTKNLKRMKQAHRC